MSKKSLNNRTLIILSLIYSSLVSYTQTPLNVVSDFNYHQQVPFSIVEVDGRLFTAGLVLAKTDSFNREVFFVEYDKKLNPRNHTILKEDNGTYTFSNSSKELITFNGKLYKGCSEDASGLDNTSSYGFIAEYDIESKEVRYFHKIQDTLNFEFSLSPTSLGLSDSGIMNVLYSTGVNDIYIQSFDLANEGNLINQIRYSDDIINYYPSELLQVSDGLIIIGQLVDKIENQYLGTFIWKFDEDLIITQQNTISNPLYRTHEIQAVVDSEQNIILSYNEHEGDLSTLRPLAIKMDQSLNIEWAKPIGDLDFRPHNTFYTGVVESCQKDGYLFCGLDGSRDSISIQRGQAAKLSLDGERIWHRKYIPYLGKNQRSSNLSDMIKCSDGNYLLCGDASNSNAEQDSIYFLTWMLKIDEDGHIVLADTSSSVTTLEEDRVRIFPNPTSEWLYIEHDDINYLSYSLYDSQGRLAVELKNLEAHTSYMLDVSTFHSGLYYLHIIDSHRRRQIETIVIE